MSLYSKQSSLVHHKQDTLGETPLLGYTEKKTIYILNYHKKWTKNWKIFISVYGTKFKSSLPLYHWTSIQELKTKKYKKQNKDQKQNKTTNNLRTTTKTKEHLQRIKSPQNPTKTSRFCSLRLKVGFLKIFMDSVWIAKLMEIWERPNKWAVSNFPF